MVGLRYYVNYLDIFRKSSEKCAKHQSVAVSRINIFSWDAGIGCGGAKMTSVKDTKQIIRDAAMRRALLEILQEATKDYTWGPSDQPWPEVVRDDDDVKRELKRILKL